MTITLRFELECEAAGDPSYEISYRWLRNGLPLEYSARIHWVKEATTLVILDSIVSWIDILFCARIHRVLSYEGRVFVVRWIERVNFMIQCLER